LRAQLVAGGNHRETVELPALAVRLLAQILREIAKGNAVTVVPVEQEITTQDAAEILNISRPTLIRLLDEGKIPHTQVRSHRKVRLADVLAFKEQLQKASLKAMEELAAVAQDLDMGY
jgi:excisionase family DNA binding protein